MATPLDEALADAKTTAKEQLAAASQLQAERLVEQISSGWNAQVEHVFEERLTDLGARIQAHSQILARQQVTGQLNQATRRLRTFESEEQWSRAFVEATEGFCQRAALFVVNQQNLELRAMRNLTAESMDKVAVKTAPAFASAVESQETLVAIRSSSELSQPIAAMVGEGADRRFHLFPLATRDRVAAILYADSDDDRVETSALELLATFGASVIEGLTPRLNTIFGTVQPAAKPATWMSLSRQEQDLHLRAQRFARVQAAEMRLYHSRAVKDGRENSSLYAQLKPQVDGAREAFRSEYMSASASMVDYLHLELVRTLANDNVDLLGTEYPGPLVS